MNIHCVGKYPGAPARRRPYGLKPCRRRAAVLVEFAILLPILLTIVFGIIEFGYMFFVRQTLINAAREGARVAIVVVDDDNRQEIVRSRTAAVLQAGAVDPAGCTITYTAQPPPISSHTVTVSIPYSEISMFGSWFGMTDFPMSAGCMMYGRGVAG